MYLTPLNQDLRSPEVPAVMGEALPAQGGTQRRSSLKPLTIPHTKDSPRPRSPSRDHRPRRGGLRRRSWALEDAVPEALRTAYDGMRWLLGASRVAHVICWVLHLFPSPEGGPAFPGGDLSVEDVVDSAALANPDPEAPQIPAPDEDGKEDGRKEVHKER